MADLNKMTIKIFADTSELRKEVDELIHKLHILEEKRRALGIEAEITSPQFAIVGEPGPELYTLSVEMKDGA